MEWQFAISSSCFFNDNSGGAVNFIRRVTFFLYLLLDFHYEYYWNFYRVSWSRVLFFKFFFRYLSSVQTFKHRKLVNFYFKPTELYIQSDVVLSGKYAYRNKFWAVDRENWPQIIYVVRKYIWEDLQGVVFREATVSINDVIYIWFVRIIKVIFPVLREIV